MTTHDLARRLLRGPDLPVKINQAEYWDGDEQHTEVTPDMLYGPFPAQEYLLLDVQR